MMRAGRDYGVKIVRTISSSSTIVGDGDIHITEDGRSWRQLSETEANYQRGSGWTVPPVLGTIHNGKIF